MNSTKKTENNTTEIVKFDFQGDTLDVVQDGGDVVYVGIRSACVNLGVDFKTQLRKLKNDASQGVVMMTIPSAGGAQETACVPLRALPLWLATIHPSKVKPELREKLIAYKLEAQEVLADHFLGKRGLALDFERRVQRIELENAMLRAQQDLLDPMGPGVIGNPRAEIWILFPLRCAARAFARLNGDDSKKSVTREFHDMEDQVRMHVSHPRTLAAGKWDNLPIPKLGAARGKVAEIEARVERLRKRVEAEEAKAVQLEIPETH